MRVNITCRNVICDIISLRNLDNMRLTQHNLSKMSKEGKLVYEELRELLKCADLTINSYCKQQKITVTVIMNKIYRETLTLNEFIQIANNIGYSVYAENSEQQIKLTESTQTLTYKDAMKLTKVLGFDITFKKVYE